MVYTSREVVRAASAALRLAFLLAFGLTGAMALHRARRWARGRAR